MPQDSNRFLLMREQMTREDGSVTKDPKEATDYYIEIDTKPLLDEEIGNSRPFDPNHLYERCHSARDIREEILQQIMDSEDDMFLGVKRTPSSPGVEIESGPESARLMRAKPVPGNAQYDYANMISSGGPRLHAFRKPR